MLGPSLTESCGLDGEKKAKVRGYGPCVVVSAGGDKLVAGALRRTGWNAHDLQLCLFRG